MIATETATSVRASDGPVLPALRGAQPTAGTEPRPQTVLVVDDDQDFSRALSWGMAARGYRVVQAFDGASAIERATSLVPALVLLDLRLPDIDGFRVLHRLRALRSRTPVQVIMITGVDDPDLEQRAQAYGVASLLRKPVTPNELARAMESVLGR